MTALLSPIDLPTLRQSTDPFADKFVETLEVALAAGLAWEEDRVYGTRKRGHGPTLNSAFGQDAAMVIRILQNTISLMSSELAPFRR